MRVESAGESRRWAGRRTSEGGWWGGPGGGRAREGGGVGREADERGRVVGWVQGRKRGAVAPFFLKGGAPPPFLREERRSSPPFLKGGKEEKPFLSSLIRCWRLFSEEFSLSLPKPATRTLKPQTLQPATTRNLDPKPATQTLKPKP